MNSKFTCEWKGYYKMNKAICIRDFEGVGFLKENNDKDKKVHIKKVILLNGIIKDAFGMMMFVLAIWMLILVNIFNFKKSKDLNFP